MAQPDVSVIVTTYQMPGHLRRVLASIARQTVARRLEVIVTDDGSADETPEVVRTFSQSTDLPVKFITHPHAGFHLTRCRNNAARVAASPYLLFLDGDCLIPPDHVEHYLSARQVGTVHYGYCCRLERSVSERIDEAAIASSDFQNWATAAELRKLALIHYKGLFYQWLGHRTKPALKGGNVGIWRADFQHINGFDENFRAWGCEDDDLSHRIRSAGLRVRSILNRTRTYHLWHPPATTKPATKWSAGQNVQYLQRRGRLACCVNGLRKRELSDLSVKLIGRPEDFRAADQFQRQVFGQPGSGAAEVELLFHPGQGNFSRAVDCRVLVTDDPQRVPARLLGRADIVVPTDPIRAAQILTQQLHLTVAEQQAAGHAAA